jgi:hypothetical protein
MKVIQGLLGRCSHLLLPAMLALAALGNAHAQYRSQWDPTILEIRQLPTYCQGQFRPELAKQPGFSLPPNCGWVNHFCPGLVLLNRASDASRSKKDRSYALSQVRGELAYTRKHITPNCPLADDLAAAEMRERFLKSTLK